MFSMAGGMPQILIGLTEDTSLFGKLVLDIGMVEGDQIDRIVESGTEQKNISSRGIVRGRIGNRSFVLYYHVLESDGICI